MAHPQRLADRGQGVKGDRSPTRLVSLPSPGRRERMLDAFREMARREGAAAAPVCAVAEIDDVYGRLRGHWYVYRRRGTLWERCTLVFDPAGIAHRPSPAQWRRADRNEVADVMLHANWNAAGCLAFDRYGLLRGRLSESS